MKVLQLGKFYPVRGGVEKVMWDLTRGLNERGVECRMLCAFNEELSEEEKSDGRLILVKAWKKLAATMIAPGMISRLRKICSGYDIIHVHHPDPMAALALRLSGYRGRVILHWHSDILKQKTLLKFYRPLQDWLVRRADRIVGTSPVYVAESPYLKDVQDKVTFLPIGVEELPECPAWKGDGRKIVFSLGRLVGYKGYDYLVEAAKYLPDDYRVVIGGAGPLRDELQQKINGLGLRDKVSLIGRVESEDLPGWFRSCSVFALSSVWKTEAFAIVQVEAMCCGKPVVATKIPGSGVSWVNEDGVSGINVPVEDARALADAIMEISADDAVYARFSSAARKRYEDNFTFGKMIDNCLKIYETE